MPVRTCRRRVRRRCHQVVALVVPIAHAMPWLPIVGASVLASLALLPALLMRQSDPYAGLRGLRIAAVLLGTGASFAIVDRVAPGLAVPAPRWVRQWVRLLLALVPAAMVWLALYVAAVARIGRAGTAPARDLFVEAAVCVLTGVAGASVAARRHHTAAGALAGPLTQFMLVVAGAFVGTAYSPWAPPNSPHWSAIQRGWSIALLLAIAVLLLANRDTWPILGRAGRRYRPHRG